MRVLVTALSTLIFMAPAGRIGHEAPSAWSVRRTPPARLFQSLAPYAATPLDVVDRMLALAAITKADVVYDLGSGDGRIPIRAAEKYGARGVGIEIDPQRVEQARANARAAGVAHLVEFREQDALSADVSDATVVTLYLLSSSNAKLRPMLTRQLKPGARIVSHAFSMGPSWPADRVDRFISERGDEVTLYLWTIGGTNGRRGGPNEVVGDAPLPRR